MASITESFGIAITVLFIAGLFLVMLYERHRTKARKNAAV